MSTNTCFLGYDPIENQYKVLFLTTYNPKHYYHVFTLGETTTTTKKWKTIQGGVESHLPLPGGVGINGTIYYQAGTTEYGATSLYKMMSFNVRSEEFYHVDAPKTLMDDRSYVINYQGKLGFVCCANGVEVWVMETQGWSRVFFSEMEGSDKWRTMGVTRGGEIVLVSFEYQSHDVLRVLYYDMKGDSKRYVDLQGFEAMKRGHDETSPSPRVRLCHGGDLNIPLDITVEILKKLPAKSLVRFQCVSKIWSSIISKRRDFIDSIIAQPQRGESFIFGYTSGNYTECFLLNSSIYTRTTHNGSSLMIPEQLQNHVRGLICCWSDSRREAAIYNLTTRQSFYLPKNKSMHKGTCFFGYDPIENQYKVLFIPMGKMEQSFQVFTLGDPEGKQWRNIQGVRSLFPLNGAVCINGNIYYRVAEDDYNSLYKLMRFDVRSEKFYHVNVPNILMDRYSYLINYQGKIGFVCYGPGVEVCVMEIQGWSKVFSFEMNDFNEWLSLGVTRGGGEMVFVKWPSLSPDFIWVLYYDLKLNIRINLKGIYPKERKRYSCNLIIWMVQDYVENTMRLY